MKVLFILMFFFFPSLISGKDTYNWKHIRTEVYEECYNVYTNRWNKKKTFDINISKVTIKQKEKKIIVSLRSFTNPYIIYRQRFDYFKISTTGKKEKIEKKELDTEDVAYVVECGKTMSLGFDIPDAKSIKSCMLKFEICTDENRFYFINIYLEKIEKNISQGQKG